MKPTYGGRYRPPRPKSSPLVTPEGAKKLRDELDQLWREKRPQVTQAVKEAAALGDRSENAEYIYGKKQLREIDSRVRFLRKRIETVKVVEGIPDDRAKIFFGAWVTLVDEQDIERDVRIVGADEIDPKRGYISLDSPLASALLGKQVNDEVVLETLSKSYEVLAIRYQDVKD